MNSLEPTSFQSFRSAAVDRSDESNWLDVVTRQIAALRFGSVQITVHEGRVVQVETSVKVRFDKPR